MVLVVISTVNRRSSETAVYLLSSLYKFLLLVIAVIGILDRLWVITLGVIADPHVIPLYDTQQIELVIIAT